MRRNNVLPQSPKGIAPPSPNRIFAASLLLATLFQFPAQGQDNPALEVAAKHSFDDSGSLAAMGDDTGVVNSGGYEAGRGLITTEGPSGMFINPTSGTLPKGAFTAQWCALFPDIEFNADTVSHGFLVAYGVTDWLELGATALLPADGGGGMGGMGGGGNTFGPMARVRLLKDAGWMPEASVGYYGKFGDDTDAHTIFAAFFKRVPIGNEEGFVKSVGFHAGVRYYWPDAGDEEVRVFGGVELQLPYRIYAVGEISSEDGGDTESPHAFGLQWRAGGVNISSALLQGGGGGDYAFYFGLGGALSF